jgi:hypothetical protein
MAYCIMASASRESQIRYLFVILSPGGRRSPRRAIKVRSSASRVALGVAPAEPSRRVCDLRFENKDLRGAIPLDS